MNNKQQVNFQSKTISILRWIFFLPLALITSFVMSYSLDLICFYWTAFSGVDPNALFNTMYRSWISSVLMGASFVYVGKEVAPNHKKHVSIFLFSIGSAIVGILFFLALIEKDYWDMLFSFFILIGLFCVSYSSFFKNHCE